MIGGHRDFPPLVVCSPSRAFPPSAARSRTRPRLSTSSTSARRTNSTALPFTARWLGGLILPFPLQAEGCSRNPGSRGPPWHAHTAPRESAQARTHSTESQRAGKATHPAPASTQRLTADARAVKLQPLGNPWRQPIDGREFDLHPCRRLLRCSNLGQLRSSSRFPSSLARTRHRLPRAPLSDLSPSPPPSRSPSPEEVRDCPGIARPADGLSGAARRSPIQGASESATVSSQRLCFPRLARAGKDGRAIWDVWAI